MAILFANHGRTSAKRAYEEAQVAVAAGIQKEAAIANPTRGGGGRRMG